MQVRVFLVVSSGQDPTNERKTNTWVGGRGRNGGESLVMVQPMKGTQTKLKNKSNCQVAGGQGLETLPVGSHHEGF